MTEEVKELAAKGAIQRTSTGGFTSLMFLVTKSDGSWRPVINLKALNRHVITRHFKMESIRTVKGLMMKGDWLLKGCIPCGSNSPGTPGIPQVPLARPTLAVSSSPFRPKQCPVVRLYKALETSCVDASKGGNQVSPLIMAKHREEAAIPWVHNQPEEERPLTNTGAGISGICPEVSQDDHCFTGSEVTNLEEDGQADDGTRSDNDPGPSSLGRDDGCSTPRKTLGTTPLPTVGSGQGKSNQAFLSYDSKTQVSKSN